MLGPVRNGFGVMLGVALERRRLALGSCYDGFQFLLGIVLEPCYEWFRVMLGVTLDPVRSGVGVLVSVVVGSY